jgi:outer membrane protein TolC
MRYRLGIALIIAPLAGAGAQVAPPPTSHLTPVSLSITEALARADSVSEAVGIARAGVNQAEANRQRAKSWRLPQLNGSASYSRTIESQFSDFASSGGSDSIPAPIDCSRYTPIPDAPIGIRVDSLERGLDCTANGSGMDFSTLPFGRPNTYNFGLSLSQSVFNPVIGAQVSAAVAGRDAADQGLVGEKTRAVLNMAQGYFDAQLADRLVEITDSTLAQAERAYEQTRLERSVGNVAEFDLLRATVSRDNQRRAVIQRRAARDRAFVRLRQLLNLPSATPLTLTTPLGDSAHAALPPSVAASASDTSIAARVPVRQATAELRASEAQFRAARDARLPTLALSSSYAKIAFPEQVFGLNSFVTDWFVMLRVDVPLYTGGRLRAEASGAEAAREAAALRLRYAQKQADREATDASSDLIAAEAVWAASDGTAELAARAYQIAEVRYQNGLSTLTDLGDVRIQLQVAQANRALAARDLQVTRVRSALLRDLPFGTAIQAGAGSL